MNEITAYPPLFGFVVLVLLLVIALLFVIASQASQIDQLRVMLGLRGPGSEFKDAAGKAYLDELTGAGE